MGYVYETVCRQMCTFSCMMWSQSYNRIKCDCWVHDHLIAYRSRIIQLIPVILIMLPLFFGSCRSFISIMCCVMLPLSFLPRFLFFGSCRSLPHWMLMPVLLEGEDDIPET